MSFVDHASDPRIFGAAMPIVPKKEPRTATTLRVTPSLLQEIDEIAERTGRSRNDAIEFLLMWAVERAKQELEQQAREAAEKGGRRKRT